MIFIGETLTIRLFKNKKLSPFKVERNIANIKKKNENERNKNEKEHRTPYTHTHFLWGKRWNWHKTCTYNECMTPCNIYTGGWMYVYEHGHMDRRSFFFNSVAAAAAYFIQLQTFMRSYEM